jgi:DNA topoisomerase-1
MEKCIHRKSYGNGFTYRYETGNTVKNRQLKKWIKSLVIPPAWQEVEITQDRGAKVLVSGRDDKGRKQYIYNPSWVESASEQKFQRILRFGQQLETMRRVTGQHLAKRPIAENTVLACMVRMIDEAFFRLGNQRYTEQNDTYGLTTLRSKHMKVNNNTIMFEYEGKSHKLQQRLVEDKAVRDVLLAINEMSGYEIFDISLADGERQKLTGSDVNEYIAQTMGEDFTAKDFRTWAGTVLMAVALSEVGCCDDDKDNQSNIVKAIKSVANHLGNTPAVCRESYIHPDVILHYESGRTIENFRKQLASKPSSLMSFEESATLKLLLS